MELQGQPIGNSGSGGKVTTDPESNNTIPDNTGAVASDSLAAESANSGGAFAQNHGAPQKVSGSNSTFNNTDTSGATTLQPAANKSERIDIPQDSESSAGLKYAEGVGGQGQFPGQHNADGYAGGPTSAKQELGGGSDGVYRASSNAADRTQQSMHNSGIQGAGSGKPGSKNAAEGDFDNNPENNASFTADIGGDNDPARVAIGGMQRNAQSASGATGPRQPMNQEGTGPYDALNSEEQA